MNITWKILVVTIMYVTTVSVQSGFAQELNCKIDVVFPTVEGTNHNVFDILKNEITEYMNTTKWTDLNFQPNEKINCRLYLTISEYSGNRMKGDIQIQVSRPVYNSTYTTELLNYKDSRVEFDFSEGDRLVKNDNTWESNLNSLLDFYAYLIIALDSDSFAPRGGQTFFDKAMSIVQMSQLSGEPGWKIYEDNHNRSALLGVFTESNTSRIRDIYYDYHRSGLDVMADNVDKGRGTIAECVSKLAKIYSEAPMSVAVTIFGDAKLDEIINIFLNSPDDQKESVYKTLTGIYPSDFERLDKLKQFH